MRELPAGHPPITFHLTPLDVWLAQAGSPQYLPEAFERDGFIHCTDAAEELMAVGNRYYQADRRDYVALSIARDRISSPVRHEDVGRIYPHIYGPLNVDAVVAVRAVRRAADGAFLGIDA
jgi:uncharacterized protein (DUF952 family)